MRRVAMPPRKKPLRRSRERRLVAQHAPERAFAVRVLVPPGDGVDIDRVHFGKYARSPDGPITIPKQLPLRSELHRRAVADLSCVACGRAAPTQCCHIDRGKALASKTDDRLTWSGCAACHHHVGTSGVLAKGVRRQLEAAYVLLTVDRLLARGLWRVPMLTDEQVNELERWAEA